MGLLYCIALHVTVAFITTNKLLFFLYLQTDKFSLICAAAETYMTKVQHGQDMS